MTQSSLTANALYHQQLLHEAMSLIRCLQLAENNHTDRLDKEEASAVLDVLGAKMEEIFNLT